ncbi:hypothetical protein ACLMJK_008917 [Lecanora helva]
MEAPNDWYGKDENPKIRYQIGDIREVAHSNQVKTTSRYSRIPKFGSGSALERKYNRDCQYPQSDENNGSQDDLSEGRGNEDAVIEVSFKAEVLEKGVSRTTSNV